MLTKQANQARWHVLQEHTAVRPVRARVQTLLQATMFQAQPKRARLLVLQEPTIQTRVPHGQWSALNPLSDITFQHPANQARPLVLLEPIKQTQGNPRVTMLIQGITFHPPANRARLRVLLEPLAARPARSRVQTLQQDILCHLLVSRVRLHAVQVTIKHHLVKHPAMQLMLATMFLAQPKRARLLVLLEPLAARPARFLAPMRCQAIMYQFRVNQLQQSV